MSWQWWIVTVHTPGINSILERSISLSFPLALLFPSHSSPDTHLCSKYLTYSQLGLANRKIKKNKKKKSPTQRSLAGFAVEALMSRRKKVAQQNLDACWTGCTVRMSLNGDRQKKKLLPALANIYSWWNECSAPSISALLFLISLAIHHSTYTVCVSLSSSRHSTCMHVASFLLNLQCYPISSLAWSLDSVSVALSVTLILSLSLCVLIKLLLAPFWHCCPAVTTEGGRKKNVGMMMTAQSSIWLFNSDTKVVQSSHSRYVVRLWATSRRYLYCAFL